MLPVVEALASEGLYVSVDTMNATTARAAVAVGARLVNDVSADWPTRRCSPPSPNRVPTSRSTLAGPSAEMYARAEYDDVVAEVLAELQERIGAAAAAGVPHSRVVETRASVFGKLGDRTGRCCALSRD